MTQRTAGIKRGSDAISADMVLNGGNMQSRGTGVDWVRYNTTKDFKIAQVNSMALAMAFTRENPLVLRDVQHRTYNSGNSKYLLRLAMMQNDQAIPSEMQCTRDEVIRHIKMHDPDMAHLNATHVSDNLVVEVWGDDTDRIKGETGSKLRMTTDGKPVGLDTTPNSNDGVNVGAFDTLKDVPVTGVVRFEGYYYSKSDPSKIRIQWGFLKTIISGEQHIFAKVYTDITVPTPEDDEDTINTSTYLALMDSL